MRILLANWKACNAFITMKIILSSANSANSASNAMKNILFNFIIIEMAIMTDIVSKSFPTLNTIIKTCRLFEIASDTHYILNSLSI